MIPQDLDKMRAFEASREPEPPNQLLKDALARERVLRRLEELNRKHLALRNAPPADPVKRAA